VASSKVDERKTKLEEYYRAQINDLAWIQDFFQLLESVHFSAHFSLRTLTSFADCPTNTLDKTHFGSYKTDIVELRNLLAHHPEEESTQEEMKIKKSDWTVKIFIEQDFNDIRKKIREYKKIFSDLNALI
jgi:hypothetical protein